MNINMVIIPAITVASEVSLFHTLRNFHFNPFSICGSFYFLEKRRFFIQLLL